MLKSAQDVKGDTPKKIMKSPGEITAAIIKNRQRGWMAAFFRNVNPANRFNGFSDIEITLEELGSVKKNKQETTTVSMKYRNYKNYYNQMHKVTAMKNILKTSGIMALTLSSVSLFGGIASQSGDQRNFRNRPNNLIIEKNTPVYEGDTNHQVAILEIDYPEVAANFSSAFPAAGRQLWLKEGNSLFVYFSSTGNKVTAVFTAKGRMNYSVAIISLSDVPEDIRNKIKKEYSSFSFFSARQIQARGYISYELVFENCREYIAISSTDENEIVVTDKIRKSTIDKNCAEKMP